MKQLSFLLVAFLIAAAGGAPAWAVIDDASVCGSVDLRPLLGPPLDQGDTGFCFAHSSADLVAAATGHRVSPLDLATTYVLANEDPVRDAPDMELQDFLRKHRGFLTQWHKDRAEEPQNFSPEKILTTEGIYWTGGEEMQTIFLANVFGLCDQASLPPGEKNYEEYLKAINTYHDDRVARRSYDGRELRDPIGEVTDPMAKVAVHSFENWVHRRCGRRWLPGRALLPEAMAYAKNLKQFELFQGLHMLDSVDINARLFEKINERLDHRQPVSIGYSANDLMKVSKQYPSGDHASVIAARKYEDGKCLYFVRNSFGEASDDYLARFKRTFEQGGVWVRARDLKTIYSVVWVR